MRGARSQHQLILIDHRSKNQITFSLPFVGRTINILQILYWLCSVYCLKCVSYCAKCVFRPSSILISLSIPFITCYFVNQSDVGSSQQVLCHLSQYLQVELKNPFKINKRLQFSVAVYVSVYHAIPSSLVIRPRTQHNVIPKWVLRFSVRTIIPTTIERFGSRFELSTECSSPNKTKYLNTVK